MSGHVILGAVLFMVFWVTASIIPNPIVLMITNSLVLAGAVAVAVAYVPVAWEAMKDGTSPRRMHIAIGIAYAWVGAALWRIMTMLWLLSGQPKELVNNDVMAMIHGVVFLGACYHLTSPGTLGLDQPRGRYLALGAVCGVGVLLGALILYYMPNTAWIAQEIIPHLPR